MLAIYFTYMPFVHIYTVYIYIHTYRYDFSLRQIMLVLEQHKNKIAIWGLLIQAKIGTHYIEHYLRLQKHIFTKAHMCCLSNSFQSGAPQLCLLVDTPDISIAKVNGDTNQLC